LLASSRKTKNSYFLEKKLICFLSSSALIQIFCNICNFFCCRFWKRKVSVVERWFSLCFLHHICEHFSGGGAVVISSEGELAHVGIFGRSVVCSHRLLLCCSRFLFLFLFLEWILSLGVFFFLVLQRSIFLSAPPSVPTRGFGEIGERTLSQLFLL
jgi:hypothetical protein